jgi:eukaryotic-like serine/threonine-protein kinase
MPAETPPQIPLGAASEAPQRILAGRYRLLEPLGAGGMSVVWRGRDEILERAVAVKLLNDPVDPVLRNRLRTEARAAAALNHPGIAQVYDYGEADSNEPYLVMELVDGLPLDRWLAGDDMIGWACAAAIGSDIADALHAVHEHGLVHRDVKPANAIITARGPKLVDFGICASVGQSDDEDDIVGTAAYVAPERIAGVPAGPPADVYALGMLLYRMTAGNLPWTAESPTALIKCHMLARPAPLPPRAGMPKDIAALVMRCLDKEPACRPTAAEMAAALRGQAATAATETASEDPTPSAPPSHFDARPAKPDVTAAMPAAIRSASASQMPQQSFHATVAVPRHPYARAPRRRQALIVSASGVVVAGLFGLLLADQGTPQHAPAAEPASQCDATFAIDRDWGSGFDATVTVHDQGLKLNGWTVAFDFPGDQKIAERDAEARMTVASSTATRVTATTQQAGATVTTAASHHSLQPGATLTFQLSGSYSRMNALPTSVLLSGQSCDTQVAGAATPDPTATRSPRHAQSQRDDDGEHDASGDGDRSASGHGKHGGKSRGD